MVYCQRCGKQNEEAAQFCNKCGANLKGPPRQWDKKKEDQCEEECQGGSKENKAFWGIIVLLIGIWIIFEFGIKNIPGRPSWVDNFEFWWIIPVVIGIAILVAGIRMVTKTN
jgi:uncharacterized membrane protein YvbJ